MPVLLDAEFKRLDASAAGDCDDCGTIEEDDGGSLRNGRFWGRSKNGSWRDAAFINQRQLRPI